MQFKTNKKLCELIERGNKPIENLAKFLKKSEDDAFSCLEKAYDEAINTEKYNYDGRDLVFSSDFAEIRLTPNTIFGSIYDYYLRFTFKEDEYYGQLIRKKAEFINYKNEYYPADIDSLVVYSDNMNRLNRFIYGYENSSANDNQIKDEIKVAYKKALELGNVETKGYKYTFLTDIITFKGTFLKLSVKPILNDNGEPVWCLNLVSYVSAASDMTNVSVQKPNSPAVALNSALLNFADNDESRWLKDLSEIAIKEPWSFDDDPGDKSILRNYINYIFYRLNTQNKINYYEGGTFASFNTGLFDDCYEDIYMTFRKKADDSKWKYAGICTVGNRALGKMIIGNLPEREEFLNENSSEFYDTNLKIYPDYDHILEERIHRLPVEFLKSACSDFKEALDIISLIESEPSEKRRASLWPVFELLIKNNTLLRKKIKDDFSIAVDMSVKRVRRNRNIAITSYYARNDSLCFLLPLFFNESGKPGAALVAELNRSEKPVYNGHTVLTLRQAYCDARVVNAQENSWLEI